MFISCFEKVYGHLVRIRDLSDFLSFTDGREFLSRNVCAEQMLIVSS